MSFTMVYSAMEEGAKLVLNGSRTSAAGVMTHKYGPDYGKLTDDTMASGAHAVNAYTSFRNVAVRPQCHHSIVCVLTNATIEAALSLNAMLASSALSFMRMASDTG